MKNNSLIAIQIHVRGFYYEALPYHQPALGPIWFVCFGVFFYCFIAVFISSCTSQIHTPTNLFLFFVYWFYWSTGCSAKIILLKFKIEPESRIWRKFGERFERQKIFLKKNFCVEVQKDESQEFCRNLFRDQQTNSRIWFFFQGTNGRTATLKNFLKRTKRRTKALRKKF